MFTAGYWNERALKHGHTGHAEPFYYCFDQEARKFAIAELIKQTPFLTKNKALDFGCGSGDFLEVLSEHFKCVAGYDHSDKVIDVARKRYAAQPFLISSHFKEIEQQAPYDLALSVTVLQYLDASSLEKTLQLLYKNLNAGGYLICLDSFSSVEKNQEHGLDKATNAEFSASVKTAGFKMAGVHPYYNPVLFPTPSWKQYNANLFLKLLKPFKNFPMAQKLFTRKAKEIIYREKDILLDQNSIFKIYILQK